MAKKPKVMAVLTGGGDTCAINGCIETLKSMAFVLGYRIYGIKFGWKGLLGKGDVVDLSCQPIDGWSGGSVLNSSRTNPYNVKTKDGKKIDKSGEVVDNIKKYGIDVLVTIGGDDTNSAAKKIYEQYGIPVLGFPKTIDNDLRTKTFHNYDGKSIEAVLCPGFPTAAKVVSNMVRRLRTTADTHKRIFVVEIMGRNAGWLTGTAAHGGADLILIPEIKMTRDRISKFYARVEEAYQKSLNGGLIIGVSEGVEWYNEETGKCERLYASADKDAYGHPRLGGIGGKISGDIMKNTGIDSRAQFLGYMPRAGEASRYDRQLATALGYKVAEMLINEKYGMMPTLKKIVPFSELEVYNAQSIPIEEVKNMPLPVEQYYDENNFVMKQSYIDFVSLILGNPEPIKKKDIFPRVRI